MTETVKLQLSKTVAQQAKEIAALSHRQLEDVLLEWINYGVTELPIESLPDEQILALCNLQMDSQEQENLRDLLVRNREGQLSEVEVNQLDALMEVYRQGLVRKAKALKVAVSRGLKPGLDR